jgi:hypothetical protein
MDHNTKHGYLLGAILLVLTTIAAAMLPMEDRIGLFALILALTAGIYLGFAWIDGRRLWVTLEGLVALLLLGLALAGLRSAPALIALGFLLHIAWDLAHHPRGIRTRIAPWVPPACLLYDLGVAALILLWWPGVI